MKRWAAKKLWARVAWAAVTVTAAGQGTGSARVEQKDLQYERTVTVNAAAGTRACAVLDGAVYEHSAPALADVRLYAGGQEVPYALTVSDVSRGSAMAEVLNPGVRGSHLVFDLRMPRRAYSALTLQIGATDYVATATVTGEGRVLATNTLFDLTAQGLGHWTTVRMAESDLGLLHVDLAFAGAEDKARELSPALIRGATVPASRADQTLYTTVLTTTDIDTDGRQTEADFTVPARIPVERVAFDLLPDYLRNFSRGVRIRARAEGDAGAEREQMDGTISRVKLTQNGRPIDEENLSVPATVGSNAQRKAALQVVVENGDDRPLGLKAVRLEMRQRKICFDVPEGSVRMLYGGPVGVKAPQYDYARLYTPDEAQTMAMLGAEGKNPGWVAPPVKQKPLLERYPKLLWLMLLAVVAALGGVAYWVERERAREL